MNMPQDTSASLHDPSAPAIARLADTAGRDGPVTPREVAGQLRSGGFFWLDLENPGDGEQAQVINALTIVATVFLPLSFLTGYFGMNFRTLTADVQTTLWQFILLGLLLPIASAALSLLLIHRLERRLGAGQMGR